MQLDSSRNHIIMVNLWLSMINISVMATTILPAFFGMNLHSGLPDESTQHFYAVVALSVGVAALSFPVARWLYFRHWRKMTQQELFEQKMLRWAVLVLACWRVGLVVLVGGVLCGVCSAAAPCVVCRKEGGFTRQNGERRRQQTNRQLHNTNTNTYTPTT